MRALLLLLLTLALAPASGCARMLAAAIVSAPNSTAIIPADMDVLPSIEQIQGVDAFYRVPVGPPQSSLAVYVIEPCDRRPPRGVILVLHGLQFRSAWMHDRAQKLARAGYRSVLVDSRGHGRSPGSLLTYGLQESADLVQVMDFLAARGMLNAPVGVHGLSYGGSTGIMLAARDPRVRAVVAVAPFSTLREEAADYTAAALPIFGGMIPRKTIDRAVDMAGQMGRFHPDAASAVDAVQQGCAPVLLIHGTDDWVVPAWHSMAIHEAAPDRTQLLLLRGYGHIGVWWDALGEVQRASQAWFDEHLCLPPPHLEGGFPGGEILMPGPAAPLHELPPPGNPGPPNGPRPPGVPPWSSPGPTVLRAEPPEVIGPGLPQHPASVRPTPRIMAPQRPTPLRPIPLTPAS